MSTVIEDLAKRLYERHEARRARAGQKGFEAHWADLHRPARELYLELAQEAAAYYAGDNGRLQVLVEGLTHRIAAQSELLSRRAERVEVHEDDGEME